MDITSGLGEVDHQVYLRIGGSAHSCNTHDNRGVDRQKEELFRCYLALLRAEKSRSALSGASSSNRSLSRVVGSMSDIVGANVSTFDNSMNASAQLSTNALKGLALSHVPARGHSGSDKKTHHPYGSQLLYQELTGVKRPHPAISQGW